MSRWSDRHLLVLVAAGAMALVITARPADARQSRPPAGGVPAVTPRPPVPANPDFDNAVRPSASFGTTKLNIVRATVRPQGEAPYLVLTPLPADLVSAQGLVPEAVIGTLRPSTGWEPGQPLRPADFTPNPAFVDVLQQVVGRFAPAMPEYQDVARYQRSGWLYVVDGRLPAAAEVRSKDVLGAFLIKGGIARPDDYRPNPAYAVLTTEGFVQLHPVLRDQLIGTLAARNRQGADAQTPAQPRP